MFQIEPDVISGLHRTDASLLMATDSGLYQGQIHRQTKVKSRPDRGLNQGQTGVKSGPEPFQAAALSLLDLEWQWCVWAGDVTQWVSVAGYGLNCVGLCGWLWVKLRGPLWLVMG